VEKIKKKTYDTPKGCLSALTMVENHRLNVCMCVCVCVCVCVCACVCYVCAC